jgi:two-component system, NtrC family, sensor kinase
MRFVTRLVLIHVGTVFLIVVVYMSLSHRQRQGLLRDAVHQDTETLARALQAGLNHALRDGRTLRFEDMLRAAVDEEEVFASVVFDLAGAVMAGEAVDLACLRRHIPAEVLAFGQDSGWANCSQRIYWTALPLLPPAATLVVARHGVILERSVAAALQRQLLLMLALLLTIAVTLPLMLRGALLTPLAEIMRGIRTLGERGEMPRLHVRDSAGELAELAAALNQMAEQLVEKRRELLGQAEETLALDRRLREAEKFAVIGRLSGGMAHELGSPLSVIAIRAQAIQAAPGASPSIRQHAEVIHTQVHRVSDFIQGLLHIARGHGVVFDPLDLSGLLRELCEEIGPRVRAEEVWLEIELPDEPVIVHGEKTLLRHAIRNVVRNSLHALENHVGERRIQIRVEPDEHEVRVLVEDTGPGIPSAHIDQVFEPFYTTKAMAQGMGLGLPITRGIIEEHGGELYLENLRHRGLRAVMVLPVRGGGRGAEEDGGRGVSTSG